MGPRTFAATVLISALAMNLLGPWGVSRTVGEAASIPPPPGMVNWWPGDGNPNDIRGTADGTLHGDATFAPAEVQQGFSFDGDGDFVTFGNSAGNFGTSDFSIDFWIQVNSHAANPKMGVLGKRPVCNNGSFWDVRLRGNRTLEVEIDGGTSVDDYYNVNTGAFVVSDDQFHHVAVVRSTTTLSVYVDGDLKGTATKPLVANITNQVELTAGRSECTGIDGTGFFDGLLDEIEVFHRALTLAEIQAIYDAGSDGKDKTFVFSGFFSPIDNPPTVNKVNAGRAIPVTFGLGGDRGLDIFADGYPQSEQFDCDSSAPLDDIEETVTAGSSSLSYDPITDRYTYVWKTDKSWAGTCRQLLVKLVDGTERRANFKFK